ncbi:NAD(P)-binding protein [Pseudoalteromonas xiamenensis]
MAKKIAILGGGVSAMTAAVYLTTKPDWQEHYELTVYQMGWRLGGKGASGRNAQFGQRIEEHGLHVWFGAYVNAFRTMEYVYDELARPATVPLATWQQAFRPHSYVVLEEPINSEWKTWPIEFPLIDGNPADGTLDLHFWQILKMLHAWLHQFVSELESKAKTLNKKTKVQTKKARDRSLLQHLVTEVKAAYNHFEDDVHGWFDSVKDEAQEIWSTPSILMEQLNNVVSLRAQDKQQKKLDSLSVWYLVRKIRRWLKSEIVEHLDDNDDLRRLYICADLAIAVTVGLIRDKVYDRGFGYLNQYDFKEWLARNGADKQYAVDSAPVRGFYDLVFGYEDGNFDKPNVEAGVSILAMLRIMLCYQGGVMWKMQGGMGDVIFSPIYELLEKRGVTFKFFNEVEQLRCAQDEFGQWQVNEIEILEQAPLKHDSYQPLVDVKGLPCWPSEPDYNQIREDVAEFLQSENINLESFWSGYREKYQAYFDKEAQSKTLVKGLDFDEVIFGISVAAIRHLCPTLLNVDPKFEAQATQVKAVATQAFQLWLNKTDYELGFQSSSTGEHPILSGYSEPFDTWAGMANLLDKEQWPQGNEPRNIAYFCSALPCSEYPPQNDLNFPKKMKEIVKTNWLNKVHNDMAPLWPNAYVNGDFDTTVLFTNENSTALDSQYWRANVDPTERYVLSVKGSSQYRLKTDGTIFNNLFITGDWISTGVNAGCVEAAVMAGMQTARLVGGLELEISGENGFEPFS